MDLEDWDPAWFTWGVVFSPALKARGPGADLPTPEGHAPSSPTLTARSAPPTQPAGGCLRISASEYSHSGPHEAQVIARGGCCVRRWLPGPTGSSVPETSVALPPLRP